METLSFTDSVQLVQWVEGDTVQMLLFIVVYLRPSRESIQEGPAVDCEADTAQNGYAGVLWTPESGGKRVRGAKWGRWRSHGDRRENRLDNVWGWGKISSRGKQRTGGRIVQIQRVDWGKDTRLRMRRSPLGLLDANALRTTSEAIGMVPWRRGGWFV